jgi:FtsP/CotA-like multicopper oxidase with cupredoxin domain
VSRINRSKYGLINAYFFFNIDGVSFDTIYNRVGTQNGGCTTTYHFAVHLQHLIESMAAGCHIVTVHVSKDHAFDSEFTEMTLCAQTFAP